MTRTLMMAIVCMALVIGPASAFAQQPLPGSSVSPRLWIVAGGGLAESRAGCATCDPDGVYMRSHSFLIDAGIRVNPRIDAGVELNSVPIRFDGEAPIRTTFVLGVAQMHPWVDRGLFVRAGMGVGIAGNGLAQPIGPSVAPPYTTNAIALSFGVGWEFKLSRRWAFQVHALQHVAGVGELRTETGARIRNAVGNYWALGAGIVIR